MAECIFCKIIGGEIGTTFTHQSESLVAINDTNPQAPIHQLIIPRKHIPTLMNLHEEDIQLLGEIFLTAKDLATQNGLPQDGFRIVANCGRHGGQTVDHLHFHVMGGRQLVWPPG